MTNHGLAGMARAPAKRSAPATGLLEPAGGAVISISKASQAGPTTFLVSESFDLVDARAIHQALASAGADAAATIDFRGARHCNPVAVAQLSRDIAARPGRLAIIGLGHHDHRLLAYLRRVREARSPPRPRPEPVPAGDGPALVDAP